MLKQYIYAYIEIFTRRIYFVEKLAGKIKIDSEDYMKSSLLIEGYPWIVCFKLHI